MATIKKLKFKNFKSFRSLDLDLNSAVNILVGNNEAGKSTILEGINLCLSGILHGKPQRNDISQYLFNTEAVTEYINSLITDNPQSPPSIEIEIFLEGEGLENLLGDFNSERTPQISILYLIEFDTEFQTAYDELRNAEPLNSIPVEYYKVEWRTAAREKVTARQIPLKVALIDSSNSRFQNGSDVYISRIIRDDLDEGEKVSISQAYRKMRDGFIDSEKIKILNEKIGEKAKISEKKIHICVDLSTRNAWESTLMTYLDDIPFHYVGKGEQCIVKTKLALSHSKALSSNIILLEEPENHLSHVKLNELVKNIIDEIDSKQIIISTHSSFIANKLGLKNLILLENKEVFSFNNLSTDTQKFFKKLPGFNTLRVVLSGKTILVEGPSDELIVQRCYMDQNDGRLPIEDGIDVISVGLSTLRFLEIAKPLRKKIAVITDNDGKYDTAITNKYSEFLTIENIKICADSRNTLNTLEPQTLDSNLSNMELFRKIIKIPDGKYVDNDDLNDYMKKNKTEWALNVFESSEKIIYPDYILTAVNWINE